MNKATLWTIVGVVIAVVIAWWLVNALFALISILVRLLVVAVVAVLVFLALRGVFSRRE